MKRIILVLVAAFCLITISKAQVLDPQLGPRAWEKVNVKEKKAVELSHLREADVFWSTRAWEEIDLRQKMNQPLYYPTDSTFHGKRSFIQLIVDEFVLNPNNVGDDRVKFYEDDQLRVEVTRDDILRFMLRADSVDIIDDATCATEKKFVKNDFIKIKPFMTKILIMEDWFFDKQRSVMDVRILSIGFKVPYVEIVQNPTANCQIMSFEGFGPPNMDDGKVYWMYFPQIRPVLAANETFNRQNDAMRLTFDDIFLQRIFQAFIYKKENVYNRQIKDYSAGLEALLESQKLKDEIRDFEQFLWEY